MVVVRGCWEGNVVWVQKLVAAAVNNCDFFLQTFQFFFRRTISLVKIGSRV